MLKRLSVIVLLILPFILFSCLTTGAKNSSEPGLSRRDYEALRTKLVNAAYSLEGKNSCTVNGRTFNPDCTGAVFAIYHAAGIDLAGSIAPYRGASGVEKLYNMLKENGLLHASRRPKPGDLIFWDNTYDRNGDGRENDRLTHVGMIVKADSSGNLFYIHYHYKKGIVIESMNLAKRNIYSEVKNRQEIIINSPMRMAGTSKSGKILASQLFKSFGRAYMIN
jgi:hypothetical protein